VIKKYLDKLFGRRQRVTHKDARPVVYTRDKHAVARESISRCARRTCEELQRAGYLAFVVGGAVRDLLLGRAPKDFDVATSATPEEVRSVFRRSRIIGRRFQIVHVLCGPEVVEVSTFRAHFAREAEDDHRDEHGRMLSDNVFGTQAEDALRRDFTVNALFYDPVREEVWDYVHGLKDLQARRLVMIGDPATRYREDPVRMLRAARLSAKLALAIDAKTRAPIHELRHLLENVPHARLFEEILKLLLSGNAVECVRVLRELELHHGLLPLLDIALDDAETGPFALAALRATDERLASDKPVSPAFKELWLLQPRFLQRGGNRPYRLLEHPRFRAGYDFFALRAESANAPQEAARWWERFQHAGADERERMLVADESAPKKKRRRRRARREAPETGPDTGS